MRVALVHDHLVQHGGAERVLEVLQTLYPTAPTHTLLYDRRAMDNWFGHKDIRQSILTKIPGARRFFRYLLPLMPAATEGYNLKPYDVVISSSSAFAKGVIHHPGSVHISYCHTPTRYLWSDTEEYVRDVHAPRIVKSVLPYLLSKIRSWDYLAAQRPTVFIANSKTVQKRIKTYYGRESTVIYPPVDTHLFEIAEGRKGYYLAGGRLVSYKRIDLAVEACTALNLPLKVFGSGPALHDLIRKAGPTVEFVGRVSDRTRAELYRDAIAFIHPQEEDFGITAVESMASGRPVIALARGGAVETVVEGVSGTLFQEETMESLKRVLAHFSHHQFNPQTIRAHAEQFSTVRFRAEMRAAVSAAYENRD